MVLYWVVVRDESGVLVRRESFIDHKEGLYRKQALEEAPDPPNQRCTVTTEILIPPEVPR